jgi:hypothetical protein
LASAVLCLWTMQLTITPARVAVPLMTLAVGTGVWTWLPAGEAPPPPRRLERDESEAVAGAMAGLMLMNAWYEAKLDAEIAEAEKVDAERAFGLKAARAARYYLQHPLPDRYRDDCSGFVSAVMTRAGADMWGSVLSLHERAEELDAIRWDPVPSVGDLVFFDDTHDLDEDGQFDDPLTHIGVIIDVDPDGTATFAQGGTKRGRTLGRIAVQRAEINKERGNILNTYVRQPEAWDPPDAYYLAGELWAGFARVHPGEDWTWGAGDR